MYFRYSHIEPALLFNADSYYGIELCGVIMLLRKWGMVLVRDHDDKSLWNLFLLLSFVVLLISLLTKSVSFKIIALVKL